MAPSRSFLKVIGLLAIFTAAPATIYFLYTRTGGPESKKELTFQRNLRYALMAGTDTLDFGPLTDWPWEKVCALTDGLTPKEIDEILGFEYLGKAELHWMRRPEFWTLLFVDVEREVNWGKARPVTAVRIPREGLANLRLPLGSKGTCVERHSIHARLTRTLAPVGVSPVTIRFAATGGE
ncbi:MAG: hypothetical protein AB7E79_01765 [Rhodospirillaceae bacterium]